MEPIEGVDFIQGDFREAAVLAAARGSASAGGRSTSSLSDMAPNLSGIDRVRRGADGRPGRAGGRFRPAPPEAGRRLVCKVFHGSGYSQLVERFKATFQGRQAGQAEGVAGQVGRDLLVGIGLKPRCIRRR